MIVWSLPSPRVALQGPKLCPPSHNNLNLSLTAAALCFSFLCLFNVYSFISSCSCCLFCTSWVCRFLFWLYFSLCLFCWLYSLILLLYFLLSDYCLLAQLGLVINCPFFARWGKVSQFLFFIAVFEPFCNSLFVCVLVFLSLSHSRSPLPLCFLADSSRLQAG